MRIFTIPGLNVEFLQHSSSQAVCEDAYYLYTKVVSGILETTASPLPKDELLPISNLSSRREYRVLDLGTGNGILLLMLAKDFQDLYYTGIEIIKELCEIAVSNFDKLCEYLNRKLNYRILNADYSGLENILNDEKFDLIISNPPYNSKGTGRMSSDMIKATSKMELTASLGQLLHSIRNYLANEGRSFIIFPFCRSDEFEVCCNSLTLKIKSFVYIDYLTKSYHIDLEKVNSKTKIIYEVIHA